MTIRRRLGLSFLIILLLFGLNLVIYFWSTVQKTRSLNELRQAVERRLELATIDRELGNRADEVILLSEVLRTAGAATLETSQIDEAKQRVDSLGQTIERLHRLVPPPGQASFQTFATTYQQLRASWIAVYDSLLVLREAELQAAEAAVAAASRRRRAGDPVEEVAAPPSVPTPASRDTAVNQLAALEKEEEARVEQSTANYAQVQQLTDRTSVAIFLLSAMVSAALAVWVSGHLNAGLRKLTEGARRIGSGDLTSRIGMSASDELGLLARGFDQMSANLHAAQLKLTAANETLEQRNRELEESQRRLAAELAEAADYVRSLLPSPVNVPIRADWRFVPSTQLGGDAFGYHWLDSEHLAIYLLDVAGHGVGAALLGVSAMNVLRSQMLPDTDFAQPAAVLGGLNDVFQMEEHNAAYFTIWYGVYNYTTRMLRYASGGHPPALLIANGNGTGSQIKKLDRRGLVIGGFPGIEYVSTEIPIAPGSRLYVFSDGVYEIAKPGGGMLSFDEFSQMLVELTRSPDQVLEHILQRVRKIRGSDTFEDDVSLVEITFD